MLIKTEKRALNKWAKTLSPNTESHPNMGTYIKESENTDVALRIPNQMKELRGLEEIHKHWTDMRTRTQASPSCR